MNEIARERDARFGQTEKRPGAFALPRGEPSLDQKLQVARVARLRLAENGHKLAHGQFGHLQEAEDAQPRLLAGRLEAREQRREGERRAWSLIRHKHIFMSNRKPAQEGFRAASRVGAGWRAVAKFGNGSSSTRLLSVATARPER